ncbi:hypothetical protein BDW62DRAFT_212557 [Aspergillus aurantiobrunneus]
MSSRRPHPKSRSGCQRCKEKHIKCDEAWPVCGACARYNVPCVAKAAKPAKPAESQAPPSGSTAARSTVTLWEFELLHHWILRVSDSFDVSPGFHNLWREHMVRDALRHDFILHMILILSALHLALTKSPLFTEAHRSFILEGCSGATTRFRQEAQNICDSNCHAVGAFPYLLAMYAMALPHLDREEKGDDAVVDEMIHILALIKGYSLVQDSTNSWIRTRGLVPWAEDTDLMDPDSSLDQELTRALDTLPPWIDASDDEPAVRACNLMTVNAFKKILEFHVKPNLRPFPWPNAVSSDYLELLRRRNPMAMVILAHYAVILGQCSSQWWCANWGVRLISVVASILPEKYAGAIAWPCQMLMRW